MHSPSALSLSHIPEKSPHPPDHHCATSTPETTNTTTHATTSNHFHRAGLDGPGEAAAAAPCEESAGGGLGGIGGSLPAGSGGERSSDERPDSNGSADDRPFGLMASLRASTRVVVDSSAPQARQIPSMIFGLGARWGSQDTASAIVDRPQGTSGASWLYDLPLSLIKTRNACPSCSAGESRSSPGLSPGFCPERSSMPVMTWATQRRVAHGPR